MKHEHPQPSTTRLQHSSDNSGEIRSFAAWMGLVLIAFGVAIAGYLFFRIGQVVQDPRAFETQVDRWEFVVRGRVSDALPDAYETPERTIQSPQPVSNGAGTTNSASGAATTVQGRQDVEHMAEFVGRVGSKSARPAALFLIVIILTILVRIVIAIINAGIRLVYVTSGEKEYMKRIIDELVEQRRQ